MTKECEACGGKGWITGQPFLAVEGETTYDTLVVERCDVCGRFDGDWSAAVEANRVLPGKLRAILSRERHE